MGYSKLTYDDFVENEWHWRSVLKLEPPKWADQVAAKDCKPTSAVDFYADIFGDDLEDPYDNPADYKEGEYGAIALELVPQKDNKKQPYRARRHTVTKELYELYDLIDESENFCLMSPISYAGKARADKNARYLYALALEVDNICKNGITELFYSWRRKVQRTLKPTYVVCSGNGLHLYFVFTKPIPLYEPIFERLKRIKQHLVPEYWNAFVTTMQSLSDIQWEGLSQPFRCVGTKTKNNSYVMAFKTGEKITIETLNSFLPEELQLTEIYKSELPLAKAKELYPSWYQRRIVNGEKRGCWKRHEGIYYNWIQKMYRKATCGHRYHCLENLCSLAVQCNIPPEQVEEDCRRLAVHLESLTESDDNHFTDYDVLCALRTYHHPTEQAYRRRIDFISQKTAIALTPNKRNGRTQDIHIKFMNNQRAFKVEMGESTNGGRPKGSNKKMLVKAWREEHPNGKKIDCHRDTGLSRMTINRWWNEDQPSNTEKNSR